MICLDTVKRFCEEYWKIENYQEAVNDQTQTWHCHHRHEVEYNLSKIDLQAMGFYFNRPFCELIFLTSADHRRLHHKGKVVSEQSKQKSSENHKGQAAWNKGKHHSKETKQKMSDANTKYNITKEELYDLYIVRGLSTLKIATIYGCNAECIRYKLKKFNISKSRS